MSDPTPEEKADLEIVERAVNALAEHFETIQVFVTRSNSEVGAKPEGTINVALGAGNWFARYGQVKEWCVRSDEDTRLSRRHNEPY